MQYGVVIGRSHFPVKLVLLPFPVFRNPGQELSGFWRGRTPDADPPMINGHGIAISLFF